MLPALIMKQLNRLNLLTIRIIRTWQTVQTPDQTLTALANSEDPDQRSLILLFVSAYFEPHLCMVKTTLFDNSNCSGIRILRNFMNESCAGQVKIVGDRLRLSSDNELRL